VKGSLMTANFELEGQEFVALNGGPSFNFSQGISLFVGCDTQQEVDTFWEKLSEGGSKGACGWLTDRFGVSWQIVPRVLGEMLASKDRAEACRARKARLPARRLERAELKRAREPR